MEDRLEQLRFVVDELIRENQPELGHYFIMHLYSVSYFCTLLALKRKVNVEIAAACGMLHDIYQFTAGTTEKHAERGAEQARVLLTELGLYSAKEIEQIKTAISRHSRKEIVHEPLDEVLKDADVMAHCLYNTSAPVNKKEVKRYESILSELGCVMPVKSNR